MRLRNNMSVPIAGIGSRTRMRLSDIKIRCMYADTLGLAQRSLPTTEHSTNQPHGLVKPTPAGTAVRSLLDRV